MPMLIETPEDEIKFRLGAAIVENVALRAEIAQLQRALAEKNAPDQHPPATPDLA